ASLPNTTLTSTVRATSDHVPLLVAATTTTPIPRSFRLERAWLLQPSFIENALLAWSDVPKHGCAVANLVARIKALRRASKVWDRLSLFIRERAAIWKQRGKFKALREGDANTRYFQERASMRLRSNKIQTIESNGESFSSLEDKTTILTEYYSSILGNQRTSSSSVDFQDLYQGCTKAAPQELIAPFSLKEIKEAVSGMDKNSAPSPDGIGSACGTADLERINRAHIVLIPKRPGATAPDAFRPISLQNFPIKVITKTLTTRLQKQINHLIELDQTGFMKGRSITENFVYATELQMIKKDGDVRHPIVDEACLVLQYANDTLILARATVQDVQRLKEILDSFAAATGLQINYNKTTAVPMHVNPITMKRLIGILQCKQESFPQTYLGLPLSNCKLKRSSFAPLIAKIDKRLAGWGAMLLSPAGRVVLINSVLNGLPLYLMTALQLPAGILEQIEAKHRSFLWTGTDKSKAGQCLVAWESACKSKEDGGLGIRRLDVQNSCVLLKLVHRLYHLGSSSWAAWARTRTDLASLQGEVFGHHWDAVRALLPAYRSITRVMVGNGKTTNFWLDLW
ncbi:hypothetical protein U9M48_000451, partial [Paspalum notatum var. saurae]